MVTITAQCVENSGELKLENVLERLAFLIVQEHYYYQSLI